MAKAASERPLRAARRSAIVLALDVAVGVLSLIAAVDLRVGTQAGEIMLAEAGAAIPVFAPVAFVTFAVLGLHRRIWRYSSISDLVAIAEAATLAIVVYMLLLFALDGLEWMPRSIPVIHWLVLVVALGSMRLVRRLAGEYLSGTYFPPSPAIAPERMSRPALVIGSEAEVEQLLRQLEVQPYAEFRAVGVLDELGIHKRMRIRGVPILGSYSELAHVVERMEAKEERPECVVFAGTGDRLRGAAMVGIIADAQRLNLKVAYTTGLTEYSRQVRSEVDFRYADVADLLGRSPAKLDSSVVSETIAGRRVLITGAGGTIGRELARQIAGFHPAKLLLLDANEFNLYEVDLEMGENHPEVDRVPLLCSIRQRRQLMRLFAEHRPDLVFHAAALKHVPLVESHHSAGVQTNILGTRNVADAALRYRVKAMVQVSTDKAVNPVGFMGMTKRLGELYCQALDLEGHGNPSTPRFMTVRFGNVIGSSGSLIPLFQRQLSHGGPLTVTHPEIERFFMTVHEAVQLILHSASRGLRGGVARGRIFVLDMGEPVRIIDIARRMIRLAGLEPEVEVPIDIIGLRPGEKLYEELFDSAEKRLSSTVAGVFEAEPTPIPLAVLNQAITALEEASAEGDEAKCRMLAEDVLAHVCEADARRTAPTAATQGTAPLAA